MIPKKNSPFSEFDRITSEIEEMFFRFYGGPRLRMMKAGSFQPLADVYYMKDSHTVVVKMEIPGVAPDDVHITLQDKALVVEGVRFDQRQEGEKVYQQMEIDYGPFKRKIMLPVNVDVKSAKAAYRDGFLTLELPVAEHKKTAIRVPISVKEQK